MGALVLGPRIGKYGRTASHGRFPGHNIPFAVLGTFILLVGWYGFNPGSELAADGAIGGIAVTTTIVGGRRCDHCDAGDLGQGRQARCRDDGQRHARRPGRRSRPGLRRGEQRRRTDHRLGSRRHRGRQCVRSSTGSRSTTPSVRSRVHGVCGAFGTLCVGLFATADTDFWKQGLFYGGGADQLVTQAIGVVAVGAFVAVTAGPLFLGLKRPSACGCRRRRRSPASTSPNMAPLATRSNRTSNRAG